MNRFSVKILLVSVLALLLSFFAVTSTVKATRAAVKAQAVPTGELIINEVMSANIDMFLDPSYNYGGWIEIYNPGNKSQSLYGYYVSDDPTNLMKFRIFTDAPTVPAKGFACIWFDHYEELYSQVNFKLDVNGGSIYLADGSGNLVAQADYPKAFSRTSYARITDGSNTWGFTAAPTPAASNNNAPYATERLAAPEVTPNGQLFTRNVSVQVTAPNDVQIYYTTDGSTPTKEKGTLLQNRQLTVSATTTYRFRAFKNGCLPSAVVTRSFIKNDKGYTLPIVSVVTDQRHLDDDEIGVMVKGSNPLSPAGRGQSTPCNWNNDWDRPVNFEFILPEGGAVVNQEVDLSICGGWSRAYQPHSFKLKASKLYEDAKTLDYPFFWEKPYLKHKSLQLRNGGNDALSAGGAAGMIKDALLAVIARTAGLNIDNQCYQPVLHFFNGRCNGVINVREPNNKDYAYANYGYDSDSIDQFEIGPDSCYTQMRGTKDAFNLWFDLSCYASDDRNYEEIKEIVDIDSYIYYMATEIYLGGVDWPRNNVKGFRLTDGGRFRFVLFDLDGAFGTTNSFSSIDGQEYAYGDCDYNTGESRYNHNEFVTIWKNMLNNAKFRRRVADAIAVVGGSAFEPSRCSAIIDSLVRQVDPMMQLFGVTARNSAGQVEGSLSNSRLSSVTRNMKNYYAMGLNNEVQRPVVLTSNNAQAQIFINEEKVPFNKFRGPLVTPITFRAVAPAGYKFVGWRGTNTGSSSGNTGTKPGTGGGGAGSQVTTSSIEETGQTIVLAQKSSWRYYDQGSLDGKNWKNTNYNMQGWKTGAAPLGYDENQRYIYPLLSTTLSYGGDPYNKHTTYYFRNTFNLANTPGANDEFFLNYCVDDGFNVYINGELAGSYNLSPTATFSDVAYDQAYGNPDYGQLQLDAKYFKKGSNTIAVEVHNNTISSTDIIWECSLGYIAGSGTGTGGGTTTEGEMLSTSPTYQMLGVPTTLEIQAVFEPLTEAELAAQGGLKPVVINEVSASNSCFVGEYFKRNDWIELYNTTNEDIDLAGYYLSDDPENPYKCQIPTDGSINTVIPAHGYRVVWCDKLANTPTELHASFKLASEGGDVVLLAPQSDWYDCYNYVPHTGECSAGRYPDGTNTYYALSHATPGKPNMMTTYNALYTPEEHQVITSIDEQIAEALSPLRLHYAGTSVYVRGPRTGNVHLQIVNAQGQTMRLAEVSLDCGIAALSVADLPAGCYIVRAEGAGMKNTSLKFVKTR